MMCLLGTLTIYINMVQESNKEILKYGNLEQECCESFMIPDLEEVTEPDKLFEILLETANETEGNIIKTSLIDGDSKGQYKITKYILITNDDSAYMDFYDLKKGTNLTSQRTQTIDSGFFVSTEDSLDANQVGVLKNHMLNMQLSIYSMGNLFDYLKGSGLYYVELPEDKSIDEFTQILQANIQKECGIYVDVEDLEGQTSTIGIPYVDLAQYYVVLLVVGGLFLILIMYYLLKKRRVITIMRLYGLRDWTVFVNLFKNTIMTYPVFMVILFAVLVIWHREMPYVLQVMKYAIALYPCVLLAFWCIYKLLNKKFDFLQALKGKKYIKGILALNIVAELLCIIFVFYSGAGIYTDIKQLLQDKEKYKSWSVAEDYGVFYPLYVGEEQTQKEEIERDKVIGNELYSYLNSQGALFVNAKEYEEEYISLNAEYMTDNYEQSLQVNPNYLQKYEVYDEDGNRILVDESETDLILLVPEYEKEKEEEIIAYYKKQQASYGEVAQDYYGENIDSLENQNIEIIWMKDDQTIFTFNPSVDLNKSSVDNPIIQVLTEKNSYLPQRIGVLGNGNTDPLKVKLNGSSKDTYESMKEVLEELGLSDNLKAIVSVNEQATASLVTIKANLHLAIRLLLMLVALVLYLAYQTIYLMFEKNKKQYIVMNLFGLRMRMIYRKMTLIVLSMIFIPAIIYSLVIKYGGILYILLAMIINGLIHFGVMSRCVRKQLVISRSDVLKGE